MKNQSRISSLFIVLLMVSWGSLRAQTFNCPLTNDTLYYFTCDIRGASVNPLTIAGISKSPEIGKVSQKNVASFINSFYEKHFYVPDLFGGYNKMILACMGDSSGSEYLRTHQLKIMETTSNLSERGHNKKIRLESGETVFLNIVKVAGTFWVVDKNAKGIVKSSNEPDINDIVQIDTCYVPFEIKVYKTTLH